MMAWGANGFGQATVPGGLSNVVTVAAGGAHALALKRDGTVTGWGSDGSGESESPPDLTNAMAIAAGGGRRAEASFPAVWRPSSRLASQCV
jgi:hypothetical protein